MSKATDPIEAALAAYLALDPDARAALRRRLLARAGQDERGRMLEEARREGLGGPSAPPRRGFRPPSEGVLEYLATARQALARYGPPDAYRPGDEDALDLVREETLVALEPIEALLKSYFRYEVHGIENVPRTGRAIIVSNHGLLPVDGWFLSYELERRLGRWPRGLTDWRIYRIPLLRQLFMDMGTVVGSHENGDRLLAREELLFIMPGGSKEAWKSSKYRYRLLWKNRTGFVRLALRNQAPIIPSANVGTDDTYRVFFDGYSTAYKLFGSKKALLPISVPLGLGPLPLPVKMTQYVGEPIRFPYPPEAEQDPAIVAECQDEVKAKVYALIDRGLRERQERRLENL